MSQDMLVQPETSIEVDGLIWAQRKARNVVNALVPFLDRKGETAPPPDLEALDLAAAARDVRSHGFGGGSCGIFRQVCREDEQQLVVVQSLHLLSSGLPTRNGPARCAWLRPSGGRKVRWSADRASIPPVRGPARARFPSRFAKRGRGFRRPARRRAGR